MKIACMIILVGCMSTSLLAQMLSPPQQFESYVRERYKSEFTRNELDRFLRDLPWSLEQKKKAEKLLAGDAIRMTRIFGDYAGLLRLSDGELPGFATRMMHLLDGEFREFWQNIKPDTRKLLFENPEYISAMLTILAQMADSPESLAYKQRLARYPDALVFLHRFPSLLGVDMDRLPIILHLLKHLNLASDNADTIARLDGILNDWHRLLIPLYVGTQENYGPAAGLTLLTVPEFFNRTNDLAVDLRKNQCIWSVLMSQLGFIRERHERSVNWLRDVKDIASLIHRRSSDSRLTPAEWMEFLLHTAPANGKALKLIWEMREDQDGLAAIDAFLLHLRDKKIPFSMMLELIKFARNSTDLLFIIEIVQAPIYAETSQSMYPLIIMSELLPDIDDNFITMLKTHQHKLIAYLSDPNYGVTTSARWALARRTNLLDYDFNESTFRTALRVIPGGNLANVAIKAFSGYPVSKLEMGMAAIDVGRATLFVFTMGGSEVVTEVGTQVVSDVATKGGETAAQSAAEAAIESTAAKLTEVAVDRSMQDVITSALNTAYQFVVENADLINDSLDCVEGLANDVKRIKAYLDDAVNQHSFRRREQELFENAQSDYLSQEAAKLVFHRFSHLPLRKQEHFQRTLMAGRSDTVRVQLPESNNDWLAIFDGKARLNSILLVTLGDMK